MRLKEYIARIREEIIEEIQKAISDDDWDWRDDPEFRQVKWVMDRLEWMGTAMKSWMRGAMGKIKGGRS